MNDTLKVAGRIGAELGAAKAENDRLREALRWYEEKVAECRKIGSLGDNARHALDLDGGFRARDALFQQADHVRDAAQMMVPSEILKAIAWGDRDDAAEAIGSLRCLLADPEGEDEIAFPDSPEPTDTYTAVDMATAAAQGFRDGQAAVEPAPAQDERKTFEAWAKTQGDRWLIVGGLQWSAGTDDYASARTNAAWAAWQERAARPAQTATQGKFRMGDLVKKSTGSEWVGRVVGWYSTEQTKEGYAVESEAHAGSVQIYPAKALEAVR